MKEVRLYPLSSEAVALVDDDDFDQVKAYHWGIKNCTGGLAYAVRVMQKDGRQVHIRMHRQILGTAKGLDVDHIDGNGLNNCRKNLRECTRRENCRNQRRLKPANKSGFKGVSWSKGKGKWEAHIKTDGRSAFIGYFKDKIEAACAYNKAAVKFHGEFASLNMIQCVANGDSKTCFIGTEIDDLTNARRDCIIRAIENKWPGDVTSIPSRDTKKVSS